MNRILSALLICLMWLAAGQEVHASANLLQDSSPPIEGDKPELTDPKGYPVLKADGDTLFLVYSRSGSLTPEDRAKRITQRIQSLVENGLYSPDSLKIEEAEGSLDLVYNEQILITVSRADAAQYETELEELAVRLRDIIDSHVQTYQEENRWHAWVLRIGLTLTAILTAVAIFFLVQKGSQRLVSWISNRQERFFMNLSYRNYTYLSKEREFVLVLQLIQVLKWLVILITLYLLLPVLFSIFPMSRDWSDVILGWVLQPVRKVLHSVWEYLPNLFSIVVIIFFMRYLIRFTKFIFKEIEAEKLEINGFHSDWAMPTYNIVRFLLFAFTLVLIFPYLPGSDSPIFKGVTVFIGVLFSLGSSSAVTNMIAGLVITYMRPFKPGDRIKIADVSGDVIEKTLLVTRIKTIKNEVITIPNSSVLTGNTVNYTLHANLQGLIVHTTITLGYDLPWRKVHQTLIDAALATDMIEREPRPFVLQTSLDDFYVSYQLNAYTREASKQAVVYSELHKNIQDFCRDRGIEIMSPHYRASRDGSGITIPKPDLEEGEGS
ncbi:mechanosensitive ion channel family protein [Algoriphagus sp. H41]|uniref:Mechanosensitive ion channel family protein n=1 Tax=Algoriphagus oliviformis TaxID=2811231 RepID=A0ABS3C6N6_9BACT|nr:mechanosensitive ion channel family protein [Algoriphagus oliviformis]MBN7812779.1 mechanosensitive ion channel family protein [Algoriphagus oliviformis]